MWHRKLILSFFIIACVFATTNNNLDLTQKKQPDKIYHPSSSHHRSWYVSWGYNKDYWSDSNIHISQPSLGNDFTVHNVSASDCPGWNTGIFNTDLMTPQYNIRIGHFLNRTHTWAIELNFDHTKYNTDLYQIARVEGVINGQPVNQNQTLTPSYFYYALHNGANELMLNLVRRKMMEDFPRTRLQLENLAQGLCCRIQKILFWVTPMMWVLRRGEIIWVGAMDGGKWVVGRQVLKRVFNWFFIIVFILN